jgi:hypothetical protein
MDTILNVNRTALMPEHLQLRIKRKTRGFVYQAIMAAIGLAVAIKNKSGIDQNCTNYPGVPYLIVQASAQLFHSLIMFLESILLRANRENHMDIIVRFDTMAFIFYFQFQTAWLIVGNLFNYSDDAINCWHSSHAG